MAIVRDARYRAKKLYIITVTHGNHASVVPVPEGSTAEDGAAMLQTLIRRDEALVKGTQIADIGKPVYRIWELCGSAHKEDMERV